MFVKHLKLMRKNLFLFLILSISIVSCSDTEENNQIDSKLNIRLEYNGEPFVFFNDYEYPDGKTFNLTRISFYLSEIRVSNSNTTLVTGIPEYVDLTNSHSDVQKAEIGFDFPLNDLNISDFSQISFNIGLTENDNSTHPNDYTSDNDLSRSAEYWISWNSYIFAKIEGNIDLDGDQIKETGIALHLGSNEALRNISFENIVNNDQVDIVINVEEIFENANNIFDIETTSRIHSLSQIDQTNEIMDNLAAAFKIQN